MIPRAETRIEVDARRALLTVAAAVAVIICGSPALVRGLAQAQQPPDQQIVPPHRPELDLGRSAEYDYEPPEPGTYRLPLIQRAGNGPVVRLDGTTSNLRACLRGRITVLSFIYTRCADPRACPYATGVLYKIHTVSEQDPVIAGNVRLITFSFDPDHDTPRTMADYSRALLKSSGSEWLFLTTASTDQLRPILDAYGQQVDRREDPQHPLGPYYHLLRVYLVDREGMIRNIYSTGLLDPRLVITDIRTLLLEEKAARSKMK